MKCKRCGDEPVLKSGYCSNHCEEMAGLEAELAEAKCRNDIFAACLVRAARLYHQAHPDSLTSPGGDITLAWVMSAVERLEKEPRWAAAWKRAAKRHRQNNAELCEMVENSPPWIVDQIRHMNELNADNIIRGFTGLRYGDEKLGNWKITVERLP